MDVSSYSYLLKYLACNGFVPYKGRGHFLEKPEQLESVLKVAAEKLGMSDAELQQKVEEYLARK